MESATVINSEAADPANSHQTYLMLNSFAYQRLSLVFLQRSFPQLMRLLELLCQLPRR